METVLFISWVKPIRVTDISTKLSDREKIIKITKVTKIQSMTQRTLNVKDIKWRDTINCKAINLK